MINKNALTLNSGYEISTTLKCSNSTQLRFFVTFKIYFSMKDGRKINLGFSRRQISKSNEIQSIVEYQNQNRSDTVKASPKGSKHTATGILSKDRYSVNAVICEWGRDALYVSVVYHHKGVPSTTTITEQYNKFIFWTVFGNATFILRGMVQSHLYKYAISQILRVECARLEKTRSFN